MPLTPYTDPHAAAILADLLNHFQLAKRTDVIIEEALDYIAAARREHPQAQIAPIERCMGATK